MFTLQILDRGQTLLYTPPAEPVLLGSGADADFRLGEDGVELRHVRLEPHATGLRLIAHAPVRLNDAPVDRAELQLGDRIEIGKAVVVVGRSVARAAEPEDVLDSPRQRSSRSSRREPVKRSRIPFVLVGLAVAIAGVLAFFNRGDAGAVDGELALIADARSAGQLERARERIAVCREQWRGSTDDRLERLAAEAAAVQAVARFAAELEAQLLDPGSGTYASWIIELRRLEDAGEPHERIAARLQRSSLRETLERRASASPLADSASLADAPPPELPESPAIASGTELAQSTAAPVAILADADRLAAQGLFAQAIAVIDAELGQAADADSLRQLQERLAGLRAEALAAMTELVAAAEALAADGNHREAVTSLALVQHRFPGDGEFAQLPAALQAIKAAGVAATAAASTGASVAGAPRPSEPAPSPVAPNGVAAAPSTVTSLSALRSQLDRVASQEAAGAFGEAAQSLRRAADMARDRDADFATRLERRAVAAARRAAFHDEVAAALDSGRRLIAALRTGRDAMLESTAGAGFVAGTERVRWADISATGIAALADQVGARGEAAIGAASMLYDNGDPAAAEALLARALRADAALAAAVNVTIADGRGDRFDERGYVLGKNGFVSQRAIELEKDVKKIVARIDGVFRKGVEERQRFVAGLLAEGPDALDAVALAFGQDLDVQIAKLEASSLQKQVERLATQREALDQARAHAKALIYDEVKYFYPYKPPAVSSDRFAEYNRVQAEVYRRIDSVKALWKDSRLEVRVPKALQTSLERIDWIVRVLQDVGAYEARKLATIEWVRALPVGSSIGIAEYCKTVAEREEIDEWRRIEAYNQVVGRDLSSSVRELLRITNEYRAMYRHRPLAIIPVICNAAQGHAEEMSRLGYFAHMSPTPARRTPFDRMKLAGYNFGVSENIALNGSALGAHNAWLGSSGHHRNLLNPRHREFGIGADGRNWVENFGGGSTYEKDPAYLDAR